MNGATDGGGSGTTMAVTLTNPVANGSALHICVGWDDSVTGPPVLSDSQGNTYGAPIQTVRDVHNSEFYAHWLLGNVVGGASFTITATFAVSTPSKAIVAKELANVVGTVDSAAGQYQGTPGTGVGAVSSGTATPAHSPALLSAFCINGTDGTATSVPGPFTSDGAFWTNSVASSLRLTSANPIAATFTAAANVAHVTLMVLADESPGVAYVRTSGPGLLEPFNPNQFRATQFGFNSAGPPFRMAAQLGGVLSVSADLGAITPLAAALSGLSSLSADLFTLRSRGGKAYVAVPGPGISPSARDQFNPLHQRLSTNPPFQTFVAAAALAGNTTVSAELTAPIALRAALGGASALSADLSGSQQLSAALTGNTSLVAGLTNGPLFAASLGTNDVLSAGLTLAAALSANLAGVTTLSGTFGAGQVFVANLAGACGLSADLTTDTQFAITFTGDTVFAGDLTNGAQFSAAFAGNSSLSVELASKPGFSAAFTGNTTLTASLSNAATVLSGSLTGNPKLIAQLSAASRMATTLGAQNALSADLETHPSSFGVAFGSVYSLTATLVSTNNLLATMRTRSSLSGDLMTLLQPPGEFADIRWVLAPRGWREPFGEFFQRPGEVLWYGIDWEDWLANRWEPNSAADLGLSIRPSLPNGYEFICTAAGDTGAFEPTWPNFQGAVVVDGSAVWTALPVSIASLEDGIDSTDASAQQAIGLDSNQVADNRSYLRVDTTQATAGVNYDVLITVDTTGGQQKIAKIRIKVR